MVFDKNFYIFSGVVWRIRRLWRRSRIFWRSILLFSKNIISNWCGELRTRCQRNLWRRVTLLLGLRTISKL
ncbi:hypothetical protein F8388_003913 [Cannabis sativa]|uniref:Uncharacterized protein n=1 Tax=Cannabis sativa TaxID=3483 RepID=A0A7J6GNW0_CANSA|nr:hypothetical protein F8388_003913 [Cannabis sativa]